MAIAPSKPYALTFEDRKDYLYAHVSAPPRDRGIALDYLSEIADKCASVRCKRLVIDRHIPLAVSETDANAAIDHLMMLARGIKLAFVNRHPPASDTLRRLIDLGVERGAPVAYFEALDDAEQWLLDGGQC
jgi:hypothetical protein